MFTTVLIASMLIWSVSAFAPVQITQPICGNLEEVDAARTCVQIQPRDKNVSLHAMLETGLDPMFTTVVLGAVLLGTMVAYEEGEYTAVSNSAKSLVADKELEETVEAAITEAAKATDCEETTVKEEAIKDETVVEPVKAEEVQAPVPEVVDIEAERKKLAKILQSSPVPEPAPTTTTETVEPLSSTPLAVKVVVKTILPWRKFGNI